MDVDLDLDAGLYDLRIGEEGVPQPLVALERQPNAAAPGAPLIVMAEALAEIARGRTATAATALGRLTTDPQDPRRAVAAAPARRRSDLLLERSQRLRLRARRPRRLPPSLRGFGPPGPRKPLKLPPPKPPASKPPSRPP